MKKRIALNCLGDNANWIGGIYYIKNIAFEITTNNNINSKYDVYVFATNENSKVFQNIHRVNVIKVSKKNKLLIPFLCYKYRIDFIYPYTHNIPFIGTKAIAWIPDFQHKYFESLFDKDEYDRRNKKFAYYSNKMPGLILSSKAAYNDFIKFFDKHRTNVQICRFVSYIEPILKNSSISIESDLLVKYNLMNVKYACIMNQFWQHKNHMVVLEAMREYFHKNPESDFLFVFTGKLEDYRSPEYIDKLKIFFEEPLIKKHSILLGFIDREEQILIMKNAEFVIQPSLFEGWGTVVEDAKVLDKTILLSDIPVHREQMNDKCILFDPYDSGALAELIKIECGKEHIDDVEKGIGDMYERAKEYSKGFEKLLKDLERK